MTIRNLDKIFRPRSVAVIGASDEAGKVGYTVLRNLLTSGFHGAVYPINRQHDQVQGLKAYAAVSLLEHAVDLAIICTPAATIPDLVQDCGESGVLGLIILSAGFREAGADGQQLEARLKEVWSRYDGMRIIGPNCLGVIVPPLKLNASFAADMPPAGSIALISQSGALCTSLLDWSVEQNVGFSNFVSLGNMLDVGFGDLIDYFGTDPATRSMLLYIESLSHARQFISASRAFSRSKPIVAYKAGRFAESARAASSHTGAMAGEDRVYDAAFRRAGIERVYSINDLFDCAELLAQKKSVYGRRLAIITNAGGPGVMATDSLLAQSGVLATLSEKTLHELNDVLPRYWSHGNPVDVLGDASPIRFKQAIDVVLEDDGVDAVLVVLTPQAMTDPTSTAAAVCEAAVHRSKPILAAWIGGARVREGRQLFSRSSIPVYETPDEAIHAFMHLVSYSENQRWLYETPRDVTFDVDSCRHRLAEQLNMLGDDRAGQTLSENDSKSLLSAYGIPVSQTRCGTTPDAAVECARQIGYPVVLKLLSPQITHKTDVGGVVLNLQTDTAVRDAFHQIVQSAQRLRPDATITGVTVQSMVPTADGLELIVGVKRDLTFGSVLLVGAGGTRAEIDKDNVLTLIPVNENHVRRMLHQLRVWPLLNGFRGHAPLAVDPLCDVLMRLSTLIVNHPEVRELDINPLLVTTDQVLGLDARIILDSSPATAKSRGYDHLAIHPYPTEFIQERELSNGARAIVRPIRPEDEARWLELLAGCTEESKHARFHYTIGAPDHNLATRYCNVDYDREIALVCENPVNGQFAGIVRLVADPDHQSAEFAILVRDDCQGQGIGVLLTQAALEVASRWDIRRITAMTQIYNVRMLSLFRELGFTTVSSHEDQGVILASKPI